jgi:hypothetical protein
MAQIVKLRRSSISGQKPTNSNLQLGELALNTADGKVFMAVSGSGGPSVQELVSTNTVNTGSIYLTDNVTASFFTGSFIGDGSGLTNIPYSGVTGLELNKITSGSVSASISPDRGLEINTDVTISGSFPPGSPSASLKVYGNTEIDGYAKFLPVTATLDTSITGSYIFVSGSTDDLYFSQNGRGYSNITRLRWLEGNLYSGLLHGGAITASGTTFNISKGNGIIVDLNASLIDDPYPTIKLIEWDNFTGQTLTNRTTHIQTYLAINDSGQIVQSTSPFVATQYNTLITLGTVLHQNLSTVNGAISYPNVAYGYKQRTYDFLKAFGPLRLSGLNIVTSGSLGLNVGSGTAFAEGRNYQVDPNNPSYITDSGTAVSKIFRYYQVSGTTFVQDTNGGNGYSGIDPTKYVLNGVLTNVGGDYSIQRVFWYPNSVTKGIVVYYGNATYGTIREAIDNLNIETFNEVENTKQNAVYLGSIIIAGNGNFTQSNKFSIVPGGLFRSIGGSGGGGNIPTSRLFDLSDVNITTEQDGDLLVYNVDTLKWESKKSLEGDYTITGSLNVTGGLTGSLDFSNITNAPTLVSGSSQIEITGTTGYSDFSSSISTSIDSLSSSIATTTNDLDGRLDSIEGVTGSYATTGSNHFNGDQTITGSLNVLTKIVTEDLYVSGDVYFGVGNNNTNRIVINSLVSSSIFPDSDSDHWLGGPNKKWRIYGDTGSFNTIKGISGQTVSIRDAVVTGSFTGSYIGDGSGLYNIPASGVTGLQLDKIVSGNASASIDNNGFYVNKNVYIDGTITAKELYIDYVTSSVLYQSGSTKFGDTADDNHNFTGSVYIDGSLTVDSITGSIDFSNLTNVPTLVSGSSQISYTGITNVPNGIVSGSPQISYTGITDVPNGIVSSSTQISYTGITDVPNGIVSGSGQVIDLGFTTTSSFEGFTSSYTTDSSSFDTRINTITGSFESFTSSYTTHSSSFDTRINTITGSFNSYTSSTDTHLTSLDYFTSSVVLTSQTSSMTVLSASYALTAAFALNAGAGGSGGGSGGGFAELNQTTPSTTWTFQHNLGQKFPIFQIFDSNDEVIIPSQIIAVSSDSATITFPSAQTGRAIASLGTGPGGMTQQFSAATTWSVSHNMGADYPIVTVYDSNRKIIFPNEIRSIDADNVEIYFSTPVAGYLNVAKGGHIISGSIDITNINLTGSNVISGSSQISNLGYATTGSNVFNGNQTINGCLTINNAKICATGTTISANTQIFNLSSFDGAFFDYVVKSGVNMRAGTIMSAWNGTNSTFNETTTVDLGNTTAVGFNVSGTGVLNATISSGTWTVEVLYRALGSGVLSPTPTATATPAPTATPTATPGPTATLAPTATPTATPTSTNYMISATGSTAPNYCDGLGGPFTVSVYGNNNDWLSVTRFYTDSGMTTPFNGNSLYYGDSDASYGTTLEINSSGYVINSYAC